MKDFTSLIEELHSWVTDTKDHRLPLELYILLCASETALRELQEERNKLQHDLWEANDLIEYINHMLEKQRVSLEMLGGLIE